MREGATEMVIGIDPGVNTGFAVWSIQDQRLLRVESCSIIDALDALDEYVAKGVALKVVFEDARKRKWFGNAGREKLQGAGSVKRDCGVIEEFLQKRGIPYRAVAPQAGATKWDDARFRKITGWPSRTNEHARDASLLVFGMRGAQ